MAGRALAWSSIEGQSGGHSMRLFSIGLVASFAMLVGAQAQAAPAAKPAIQVATEKAWAAALKVHSSTDACSDSIGMTAAKAVARYCRYQSPATHPPCDTVNACSYMTDHIDNQNIGVAGEIVPGETDMSAKDWKTLAKVRVQ